jgi:hypothetical protein
MTSLTLSEQLIAALLLIVSIPAPSPANLSFQESNQKLSAHEEQEVREFAKRLATDIEKTRDLTPYLSKPPASTLLYKAIADPNDSDELVNTDVARKVGSYQLCRFYIALWNIAYLSESYIYSRFLLQKTDVRDLSPLQQYPVHVVKFMERNPTIKKWSHDSDSSGSEHHVTTVSQFYSLLRIYNAAVVLMRAHFRRHPPESTSIYKQNLSYLRAFLNEITVDICEQNCVGLPVRAQIIKANLPVLQLLLVRVNGRLQVLLIGLHDD